MKVQQLGKSDLEITPIGFGAWAIGGGGWDSAWGSQDDKESINAIHRALDLGVNWIDTAAVYGLGHSEEIVGKAIKGREKPYIFTKCGLVWDKNRQISNNLKAKSVRKEAEDSLRRLGVEQIDLYQIHWPDPDADIEEAYTEMAKLQQEGKVRHLGVSNFSIAQLKRVQKIAPVASSQPPYSLIRREVEDEILPYCLEQNIGVIVYSPMQSGLLSGSMNADRIAKMGEGDWRSRNEEFQEPNLTRNLKLADVLRDIGYPHGLSAGVVAVAWTLQNPAVTGAIIGLRSPRQVEEMLPAAELRLTSFEEEKIAEFINAPVV